MIYATIIIITIIVYVAYPYTITKDVVVEKEVFRYINLTCPECTKTICPECEAIICPVCKSNYTQSYVTNLIKQLNSCEGRLSDCTDIDCDVTEVRLDDCRDKLDDMEDRFDNATHCLNHFNTSVCD